MVIGENIVRLSYDAYSSQYVTVRASVDAGRRRGSGRAGDRRGRHREIPSRQSASPIGAEIRALAFSPV